VKEWEGGEKVELFGPKEIVSRRERGEGEVMVATKKRGSCWLGGEKEWRKGRTVELDFELDSLACFQLHRPPPPPLGKLSLFTSPR